MKFAIHLLICFLSTTAISGYRNVLYWTPSCIYPEEECGIQNQPIMESRFESGYTYIGDNYVKVMLLDSLTSASGAARLITPYIKSTYKQAICLTLEYKMEGPGIDQLSVIQQDRQLTKIIYQVGQDKKEKWRIAKMDIVLRGGMVRFFLEGRMARATAGMAMVKGFAWKDGRCDQGSASGHTSSRMVARPGQFRRSRLFSKYWDMQDEK
ncbi:hypothetical protein HDE_00403 [Halotydeus destructor]|nr:hypothetical protein HDE_00403 [Halotydeus destructor]